LRSFQTDRYGFFVFDCDGVLLDSNPIKSGAFFETVREFGDESATALVDYHKARGGETRQAKFAYFVESILGLDLEDERELVARLVERFGEICRAELRRCPMIPGAEKYLEGLPTSARRFVVTGGGEDEVRAVFRERSLDRHFDLILGNPASKLENMQRLEGEGRFVGRGVYFGDAQLDWELAERFGLDFVYVSGTSEWAKGSDVCAGRSIVNFESIC